MLSIVKDLTLARYKYVKGDADALDLVKASIKRLHSTPSNSKKVLQYALDTYDMVKNKSKVSSYDQIDYLTSKISALLLLPFPTCDLPTIDNWDVEPWQDPEFPPQLGWQRICDIPELMSLNPQKNMFQPDEVLQQAKNCGDCSLICTMISIYSYKGNILGRIVYPHNEHGEPQYTPSGHYIIKLLIGGVWRMVDVDDYVPWNENKVIITRHGSLLPILLEKAYLKTMGGYDFRGSNAALDTYQLCGGLPSFYDLQRHQDSASVTCYNKLLDSYHKRSALICVGTGLNAPSELERNHDFAIVDMSEDQTLKLINPWNDESVRYTWQEVQEQFHVLYVNANPFHYPHKSQFNDIVKTSSAYAPRNVAYYCPQYLVTNNGKQTAQFYFTTAIKPTTHKISGTLQIKAFDTPGRMIFTNEAPVFAETPEVDALCLSILLELPPKKQIIVTPFLFDVISDMDTVALHSQLCSKEELTVARLPRPKGLKILRGSFSPVASRNGTSQYFLNPSFLLKVASKCKELKIFLMADCAAQVAVFAYNGQNPRQDDQLSSSGAYTSGVQYLVMYDVRPGTYLVVPSQYQSTRLPFHLSCLCDAEYTLEPRPTLVSGYFENTLHCTRETNLIYIKSTKPTKVVAYISQNCSLSVQQTTVVGELFINVEWRHGDAFDLEVYSDGQIELSAL